MMEPRISTPVPRLATYAFESASACSNRDERNCRLYASGCIVYGVGICCMVYAVWCMVYGVWCTVYRVWCMV